jgi:hypothetical protein
MSGIGLNVGHAAGLSLLQHPDLAAAVGTGELAHQQVSPEPAWYF